MAWGFSLFGAQRLDLGGSGLRIHDLAWGFSLGFGVWGLGLSS